MGRMVTLENVGTILRELGELGLLAVQVRWPEQPLPDQQLYQPFARGWATLAPWLGDPQIIAMRQRLHARGQITLVDADRAWTLAQCLRHTQALSGEVWETGVYQGGSATLLKLLLEEAGAAGDRTTLRLFDSFEGLPHSHHKLDFHHAGDFADTGLEQVRTTVGAEDWIDFRKGWIPATFTGLEQARIRFAHIDVDLHPAILDCCAFIYPRLVPGGMLVFDDYGLPSCPGARAAVDQFFADKREVPFPLINGQCLVVRHPY